MLPTLAVLVVLLCGAAASVALLPPGGASLPLRITSVFGLGYALVALLATMLMLAHVLTAWAMGAALAAVTAGLCVVALRRGGPRAAGTALATEARGAGLPGLLGLAVVTAVGAARLGVPANSLAGGWRYWADGLEIADLGHIPSRTLQWGAFHPPAESKLAANAYNAALSFPLAHHPYDAMAASLWLSAAGLAAGLWALGWELGLRRAAPALALAGLIGQSWPGGLRFDSTIAYKLQFFENEDIGRMCALAALVLAVSAVGGQAGRRRAAVAGAVLAAAALSHLVPTLVMAALLVAYAVAHGLVAGRLRQAATATAVTLGLAAVITGGSLLAAGGDTGLGGAGGGHYTPFEGRYDPTAALLGKRIPIKPKHTQRFYISPRDVLSADFTRATFLRSTTAAVLAVLLATVALAAAAAVWGSPAVRVAVGAATGLELLLVLAALAFSFHYAYYIQATFGTRRLFDYASLPLLLAGAAALEAGIARVPGERLAAAAAAIVVAAALAYTGLTGLRSGFGTGIPSGDLVAAAQADTACDSRLLTPFTTRGSFQALTGRTAVREGLMVFLRPGILTQALAVQAAAGRFYADPAANAGVLRSLAVDDVLAYRSSQAALDRLPQLRRSGAVGDVVVYRVLGPRRPAARPAQAAGYPCTGPPG